MQHSLLRFQTLSSSPCFRLHDNQQQREWHHDDGDRLPSSCAALSPLSCSLGFTGHCAEAAGGPIQGAGLLPRPRPRPRLSAAACGARLTSKNFRKFCSYCCLTSWFQLVMSRLLFFSLRLKLKLMAGTIQS